MTTKLILYLAISAELLFCAGMCTAKGSDIYDEIAASLKRLPTHGMPGQVGAEGKVPASGVSMLHFNDGKVGDYGYSSDLLFFNGKWIYSVLRITHYRGNLISRNDRSFFDGLHSYFERHFGPTKTYTITSDLREDGESGSVNTCAFWRNQQNGFEIDFDYQGDSAVTINLRITETAYHSDGGFLNERIRRFYHDEVFPVAGPLPEGFPATWEPDAGKTSSSITRQKNNFLTGQPQSDGHEQVGNLSDNSKIMNLPYINKILIVVGALIVFLTGVAVRQWFKSTGSAPTNKN